MSNPDRPLASSYIAESSSTQQVTAPVVTAGTRDSGVGMKGSFVHDTFMRSSGTFSPTKTSNVETTTVPAGSYTATTYTTAAYTSALPTTTYTTYGTYGTTTAPLAGSYTAQTYGITTDPLAGSYTAQTSEALKKSGHHFGASQGGVVPAGAYTSFINSIGNTPSYTSYTTTNVAPVHHGLDNISITSQSVYKPSSSFELHAVQHTSPERSSEVYKRATVTVRQSETPSRGTDSRQSLLTPYRSTMYPEFELVEDLPERRNLIESINGLLTKSSGRESLLVSPTKISIKRQSALSPADIEFETLLKEKYEDGSIYEGEARQRVKHGKGKVTYKDGTVFEGQFENGRATGNGTLRYKTGKVCYEGAWNGTTYEGQGVLQSEAPIPYNGPFNYRNLDQVENHWTRYEGEFRSGKRHGQGTLYLTNGEKFVGQFSFDQISGRGTYYLNNGQVVEGRWENGVWRD